LLRESNIQNAVIAQSQRTAGQSGVDKDFLKGLEINLPSIQTQKQIVERLDEKQEQIQALLSASVPLCELVSSLPSAILRKAFKGEL
jgi:type I restriction enzyme S subunit